MKADISQLLGSALINEADVDTKVSFRLIAGTGRPGWDILIRASAVRQRFLPSQSTKAARKSITSRSTS